MRTTLLAVLLLGASIASGDERAHEITAENVRLEMNAYRAEAGLAPLLFHEGLARAAESRMQDMADGGWWNHVSPEGTSPFVWLNVTDYRYAFAGENLAAGFETTRLLVETWMESPGHRANILGAQFTECGIAILDGSTRGPAAGRSIVVLFGRRMVEQVSTK